MLFFYTASGHATFLLREEGDPKKGWNKPLTMVCDDQIYRYTSNEQPDVQGVLEVRKSMRWIPLCRKKEFFKDVRDRDDYEASGLISFGAADGTSCSFDRFVNNGEKTFRLSPTWWESMVDGIDHKKEEIYYEFDFAFSRIRVVHHTVFYKRKEGSKTKVVRDHVDSKILRIQQCRKTP